MTTDTINRSAGNSRQGWCRQGRMELQWWLRWFLGVIDCICMLPIVTYWCPAHRRRNWHLYVEFHMLLEEFILPRSAVSCLVLSFHSKSAQSHAIPVEIFRPFTLHVCVCVCVCVYIYIYILILTQCKQSVILLCSNFNFHFRSSHNVYDIISQAM